ncbi:MAG: hypothetical protein WBD95_19525 [Xanthobacteraceae bacterium]
MHSAILTVEMPSGNYDQTWLAFSAAIAKTQGNRATRRLGPNVWQVNFQESPGALAQLVVACDQFHLPYEILPLDSAPAWIRGASPAIDKVAEDRASEGTEDD